VIQRELNAFKNFDEHWYPPGGGVAYNKRKKKEEMEKKN
jgi:hypothetical protein